MAVSPVLTYTFEDEKGATATTQVNVPTGTTFADASAIALAIATEMDAFTLGAITQITYSQPVDISAAGLQSIADVLGDVEEKARFIFRTADGSRKIVNVPTLDETVVDGGSGNIITTTPAVLAFLNLMVDGDLTVEPTDSRDSDIVVLDEAYEFFRSSGRRR